MKKLSALLPFLVLAIPTTEAQVPNYSEDIAPIIYANCSSCHHSGGIAPFPLMSYQDASGKSALISYMVSNGLMPPWPPDTTYQRYVHERILAQAEIDKIVNWVNGGSPQGDSTLAPPPPVFTTNLVLGPGDLFVKMAPYASQATPFADDYVCVVLGTGQTQNQIIRAMEVVPGNREILHHCLIYADTTGNYSPGQVFNNCGGPPSAALLGGYTPGGGPSIFPNGVSVKTGITLPANAVIILAMHYPEGTAGKVDSTGVMFHFYPPGTQNVREIFSAPVLSAWAFCIDADSIQTVSSQFNQVFTNFSILSVFPHMHLLGKSWTVYGVTPLLDTVRFIRINDWNFEWQGFYTLDYLKKLPVLSTVHGEAVYDNTSGNPNNPNSPPKKVCAGLNTTDEMHLVYFQFLLYQPGDEFIRLDSLIQLPVSVSPGHEGVVASLAVWPNPAKGAATIEYMLTRASLAELTVRGADGRLVFARAPRKQEPGTYRVSWNEGETRLPAGLYFIRLQTDDGSAVRRVVLF